MRQVESRNDAMAPSPAGRYDGRVDRRLRDLEREWRAEPTDSRLAQVLEEHRRAGLDPSLDLLRASPRWRRLTAFVSAWYEAPLTDADGSAPERIAQVEGHLGHRLPATVREWFRLVGQRLQWQDGRFATALEGLEVCSNLARGGLLVLSGGDPVATWGCRALDLARDDPPILVEVEASLFGEAEPSGPPLFPVAASDALFAFVVRETAASARPASRGRTCLGALADAVRGGMGLDARPDELARSYPDLGLARPARAFPAVLGDADTLILAGDVVRLAARTAEARARALAALASAGWRPLDP